MICLIGARTTNHRIRRTQADSNHPLLRTCRARGRMHSPFPLQSDNRLTFTSRDHTRLICNYDPRQVHGTALPAVKRHGGVRVQDVKGALRVPALFRDPIARCTGNCRLDNLPLPTANLSDTNGENPRCELRRHTNSTT